VAIGGNWWQLISSLGGNWWQLAAIGGNWWQLPPSKRVTSNVVKTLFKIYKKNKKMLYDKKDVI